MSNTGFNESREIEIQLTQEAARNHCIEDGYDEDSGSFDTQVSWEIGSSRETVDLDTWEEMPNGYEPVGDAEAQEYYEHLEDKEFYGEYDDDYDDD